VGASRLGVHGSGLSPSPDAFPPVDPSRRRRVLVQEVLVVLSLSLLASAFDAFFSFLSAPVNRTIAVSLFRDVELARQLTDIVFALAPVALVLYLAGRWQEPPSSFGLGTATLKQDASMGTLLGLAVAAGGLGIYLSAIALDVNRFVVPVPPLGHWWTVPILLLSAGQNALLEEVVVVGYLMRRLQQIGWAGGAAWATSAVLRASYHLYQGWGGFAGNLILGGIFGYVYLRWRRTWPLVVAHFMIDALAGLGYILFRGHCFGSLCIPR
jgi:membrane protease YdiL (CAAX protease family)